MKRVLAVSPHPDDVEFGLGGLLHRHQASLVTLLLVLSDRAATRGEVDNEGEQRQAAARLGVNQVYFPEAYGLESFPIRFMDSPAERDRIRALAALVVQRFRPDVIFVPGGEKHQFCNSSDQSFEIICLIPALKQCNC